MMAGQSWCVSAMCLLLHSSLVTHSHHVMILLRKCWLCISLFPGHKSLIVAEAFLVRWAALEASALSMEGIYKCL